MRSRAFGVFAAAAVAAHALSLCGCAGTAVRQTPVAVEEDAPLFEWAPDGLEGRPSVVINLTEQRAWIFLGGQLAGWTVVATGREGYGTPAGNYSILEKLVDKHSTLYGQIVDAEGNVVVADADARRDRPPPGGAFIGAPMPYWMRLTWRGVGMHAGHIPHPGSPASHGCIRLPREMAETLFAIVEIGTPVKIVY